MAGSSSSDESHQDRQTLGPHIPAPVWFGAAFVAGLAIDRVFPLTFSHELSRLVGAALLVPGLLLDLTSAAYMWRSGTTIVPGAPSTTVVTAGPFRLSRNPIYTGLAMAHAGTAVIIGSVWPLVMLPAAMAVVTRTMIEPEERYLEKQFGEQYREYRRRVRRWL